MLSGFVRKSDCGCIQHFTGIEEHYIQQDIALRTIPTLLHQHYQTIWFVPQDLHTIDLEPYQHGGTNITGLRMVDPQSEIVQRTVKRWADLELKKGRNLNISPDKLTVSTAICVCSSSQYAITSTAICVCSSLQYAITSTDICVCSSL